MKLKVISENIGRTTRFVNAETNEPIEIEGVQSVQWSVDAKGPAILTLTLMSYELEAKGITPLSKKLPSGYKANS